MGSPLSWSLLNILHGCAASTTFRREDFAICGDDFIGLGWENNFSRYLDATSSFGLVPKPVTVIRSKIGGIFCERLYVLDEDSCLSVDTHIWGSTRMFVSNEMTFDVSRQKVFPSVLLLGEATFKKLPDFPQMRELLRPLLREARRFNIDPYVPIAMGGLGIRPLSLDKVPRKRYQVIYQAIHNGQMNPLGFHCFGKDYFAQEFRACFGLLYERLKFKAKGAVSDDILDFDYEAKIAHICGVLKKLLGSEGVWPDNPSQPKIGIYWILKDFSASTPRLTNVKPYRCTYREMYDLSSRLFPTKESMSTLGLIYEDQKVPLAPT
jgi:hypothetical protein